MELIKKIFLIKNHKKLKIKEIIKKLKITRQI